MAGSLSLALGAETRLTTRVSSELHYSDNIGLASRDPGSDTVLQVVPGMAFSAKSRRGHLAIDYSLRAIDYVENDQADDLRHALSAKADLELYPEVLSVNAAASAGSRVTNPSRGVGIDDLNVTQGTQQTWSVNLNPHLRLRHGSFARSDLQLRSDVLTIGNRTKGASTGWGISYSLTSGPDFAALPWSLSYRRRGVSNSGRGTDAFERLAARIGRKLNNRWGVGLELGWEKNRVGSGYRAGSALVLSSTLNWTPNPRTKASLTVGERSFGRTVALSLSHKSRRSVIGLRYSEELSSFRANVLEASLGGPAQIFGLTVPDSSQVASEVATGLLGAVAPGLPSQAVLGAGDLAARLVAQNLPGQPASASDQLLSSLLPQTAPQSSDVFLQRRLSLAYGLTTGKTSISTSFNVVSRDSGSGSGTDSSARLASAARFVSATRVASASGLGPAASLASAARLVARANADSGATSRRGVSDTTSAALNLGRRVGPHTSANVGVTWTDRGGAGSDYQDLTITAGLSRQLSKHLSTSFRYGRVQRMGASQSAQGQYAENRLTLTLATRW